MGLEEKEKETDGTRGRLRRRRKPHNSTVRTTDRLAILDSVQHGDGAKIASLALGHIVQNTRGFLKTPGKRECKYVSLRGEAN